MDFTKEQQLAVDIRDKNILVSAAAGSGKTAVLVNRIIERVISEDDPVDIDRILVMTFTNAAAAQMKERILDAIEKKKKERPFDKNLQKQAALIHSASISTIDSFCLNVVRNHFSEINMNPDFRIADTGELKLIKLDVIQEVMEKLYEEGDEQFLSMTECFSYGKNDSQIEEIVLKLNDFSESYPEPKTWLENCSTEYCNASVDTLPSAKWLKDYFETIKAMLKSQRRLLDLACDVCTEEMGPDVYLESLEQDIEFIDSLLNINGYAELYSLLSELEKPGFAKLKTLKIPKEGEASSEEIEIRTEKKKQVTEARDKYKDYIKALFKDVLSNPIEEIAADMQEMYQRVKALTDLTIKFQEAFKEKKLEKNIVDFNDLEHMCLQILSTSENAAAEYRQCFKEIYVDEYQDSNLVQEEIVKLLCSESSEKGNLFMVGDVKQSIYGFRLARPEIFVDKYNRFPDYTEMSGADVKIDLHDNFRSRTHVIESVNDVFKQIMTEQTGKIIYDEKAALHPKATYPEGDGFKTEFIYSCHNKEINDRQLEAKMVAYKIKELMKSLKVTKNEKLVPLTYSDIVILLRSSKGWDTIFQNVLEDEGIPVHVESSTGYFSREEVSVLLDYLKIIDNPRQDIPLMDVLRSCIGNFYDEEIASIRGAFPEGDLYTSIISYCDTEIDEKNIKSLVIQNKIKHFLDELDYYRSKIGYTTVDMIITEIIDGDYGKCILAKPNGKKKYANLQMLLEKAKEYGKTSYKGIFHFNRYIETLHKYEVDFGEANILDEKDDAVRIMTIHKSKGLEFPVCFISAMGKQMNAMDERASIITDSDWGIGVDVINPSMRTRKKSLYKKAVARKKHIDNLSEELRVLYVAMTRAKEKLIMSGIVKSEDDLEKNNVILLNASSYLDLYKYACSNSIINTIDRKLYSIEEIMSTKVTEIISAEMEKETYISSIIKGNPNLPDEVVKRLEYVYPYMDDQSGLKISVSELKRKSMAIKERDSRDDAPEEKKLIKEPDKIVPDFIKKLEGTEEKPFSPALRGTAVHRMFEVWDYDLPEDMDTITQFMSDMYEKKRLEADLYPLINKKLVYNFVNSDIAHRMKEAHKNGLLRREQPFVIEDENTKMLIQGIIDAYFYEDDEIVVVDYKTDHVKEPSELIDKYRIQLDYYAKALTMLTGKKIKEKVIYSTKLNKTIIM